MKKGESISKIFGIALVFVMLASTLGGLVWAHESDVVGAGYVDVSIEQAKGIIDSDPDVIVLDVRTENEYEAGHIAGAELVPLSELEQRTGELDKDDALLVYCKSGTKSVEASNILIQHEFVSVYNMEGGINAWVNAGYPVVSSSNDLLSSEIDAILDADKPVFLFFYADWCHFCHEQMPIIDELELEYTEEIVVIRVNSEDNPRAMAEFGVTAFPTMFLISDKSADGEYRYQEFKGFTDKETLNQSFDRVTTNGDIFEGSGVDSVGITEDEPIEYTPFWDGIDIPDIPDIPELPSPEDLCPLCPEPEPGWGELVGCTCVGNDYFQPYDSSSRVRLTSCHYENHTLHDANFAEIWGGVSFFFMEPIEDYCVGDFKIVMHRCFNGVYIADDYYWCDYGCDKDQCRCSDTDGGKNYYEYGAVILELDDGFPVVTDYCINDYKLREFYTIYNSTGNSCTIDSVNFTCPSPYICRNGSCVGTCIDGKQNEGEQGIDCGGSCLRACIYDKGWYPQNYGFKFATPQGQHLSYGDCWSDKKSCAPGYGHYKDTFGNCEVCICNDFWSCCSGWDINAGLYYPIYWRHAAEKGQCLGMCLSSLEFYYGDKNPQDYDYMADEVIDLEYTGDLKRHIASEQGKTVSGEMIDHYLRVDSSYWGANDVLNKVEDALDNYPPAYGMISVLEDNGWKEEDGVWTRRRPLGHVVIPTSVEYADNETARIYIYDPNTAAAESLTLASPYISIEGSSPYIEIHKPSNTYTFYGGLPSIPRRDSYGQLWSNANDEVFDRIGYLPYDMLAGDVDIPWEWNMLCLTLILPTAVGCADAQVEDAGGRILGFSEQGPDAPTIENAMILPIFGEPDPEFPTTFALPIGDYKMNIRGTASGNYSAHIMGGSHAFVISDAEVGEGTKDTISIRYGTNGRAMLSFNTSDVEKQYSLLIASPGEDNGDVSETLYRVNSVISSGSEALFSIDPNSQSLLYTNYGDTAVTYSLQIYGALTTPLEEWDDLVNIIDNIPITQVYTFMIEPMETHTLSPEDWSNLPASEIVVEVDKCGDGACDTHENCLTCPEDCPSGVADYYCDGVSDGICDPDCTAETDPDCAERGCFIATAVYGTPMAKEIEILRQFRDKYLLTNPLGRAFVDFYYRVSPPIAEFITEHAGLKPVVRVGLVPVVAMSTVIVKTTPAEKVAMVGLMVLVSVAMAVWATRRRSRDPEYRCR